MSDKNSRNYILDVISVVIALSLISYTVVKYRNKHWKCIEGKCEKVIIGDYNSIGECQSSCSSPPKQTTYSCDTLKNQCVEINGPDGQFNKLFDCQNNCNRPVIYSNPYPYYYPQSLIAPVYPRYWRRYPRPFFPSRSGRRHRR